MWFNVIVFFEGWSLGMWLYMYQWLHVPKSERMEREDWQGQLFKPGSAYTPNIVKCFKSQHSILTWHVGRSGVKCNPPGAWWFQMYMWRSQAWWSKACSEVRAITKMWLWRNQCCKHCKPNDHPAPITNPITLILNTPIYDPNYV